MRVKNHVLLIVDESKITVEEENPKEEDKIPKSSDRSSTKRKPSQTQHPTLEKSPGSPSLINAHNSEGGSKYRLAEARFHSKPRKRSTMEYHSVDERIQRLEEITSVISKEKKDTVNLINLKIACELHEVVSFLFDDKDSYLEYLFRIGKSSLLTSSQK